MRTRRLIAAVAVSMLAVSGAPGSSPAQPAGAQAVPAPGPEALAPGFYIRVPHAAGAVYVPLDSTGRPKAPAREPASPSSPTAPGRPPSPAFPSSGQWASLTLDLDFPAVRVLMDGRDVGAPRASPGRGLLLLLAPGRHRIEIHAAGSTPFAADVDVEGGRDYLIRWPIVPSGGTAVDDARRGGGYQVVPRL